MSDLQSVYINGEWYTFPMDPAGHEDTGPEQLTAEEMARATHLHCKCAHTLDEHRDGFEWNRYNRGHCLVCECCVYRPTRFVNR